MKRLISGPLFAIAALAMLCSSKAAEAQVVKPGTRPLYVIAHRINSPAWIDEALKSGANGLEIDLRYKASTKEWFVDHDVILPTSVKLADWLEAAVKAEKKYGKQWAVLFLDIKTAEAQDELRKLIRAKLPANLPLVFGCADYAKRDTLLPVFKNGSRLDGFSIDISDGDPTPQQVNDFYSKNSIATGWYGTGLFVGGVGSKIDSSLIDAVKRRDQKKEFKKVYTWTVEKESTMDYYFRELKVDGMLVNLKFGSLGQDRIPTAVTVAKKYGVLATRDTPAFEVHPGKYQDYLLSIKTGGELGGGTDANIFVTLHGKNGDSPEYRLNGLVKGNAFERNQSDACVLKNVDDVGELQAITVRSDGGSPGADWFLDSVTVIVGGRAAGTFSYRGWLKPGQLSKKIAR